MARPNKHNTRIRVHIQIHPALKKLLLARKYVLAHDGQRFARNASMIDISEEFVEHYWNMASFSIGGKKMREAFNKMNRNI